MNLADIFSPREQDIIASCLLVSMDKSIFPEWEYSILMGLNYDEVSHLLNKWPNVNMNDEEVDVALHNILTHLLIYPHNSEQKISDAIKAPISDIEALLKKVGEVYR